MLARSSLSVAAPTCQRRRCPPLQQRPPGVLQSCCRCRQGLSQCAACVANHAAVGVLLKGQHLPIHLRAQSAFLLTAGMVSMARNKWLFCLLSLMYVSISRLYISAQQLVS